uniref:Protein kinase domain-containing protein n=1 Tax=Rhizochromulina marina TaxID=1034831 RepID=A0A7S2SQ74_9STRA|mmetsp:Transcript_344/g.1115  ORF Transcript_344/g.1115 Transcript_344/m.1115 type:complete len:663 (+) Transcript_344:229-2217(+)
MSASVVMAPPEPPLGHHQRRPSRSPPPPASHRRDDRRHSTGMDRDQFGRRRRSSSRTGGSSRRRDHGDEADVRSPPPRQRRDAREEGWEGHEAAAAEGAAKEGELTRRPSGVIGRIRQRVLERRRTTNDLVPGRSRAQSASPARSWRLSRSGRNRRRPSQVRRREHKVRTTIENEDKGDEGVSSPIVGAAEEDRSEYTHHQEYQERGRPRRNELEDSKESKRSHSRRTASRRTGSRRGGSRTSSRRSARQSSDSSHHDDSIDPAFFDRADQEYDDEDQAAVERTQEQLESRTLNRRRSDPGLLTPADIEALRIQAKREKEEEEWQRQEEAARLAERQREEAARLEAMRRASQQAKGDELTFTGWRMAKRPEVRLSELRTVDKLGEGQFGRVLRVAWKPVEASPAQELFAMKIMERERFKSKRHEAVVLRERHLMEQINHSFHTTLVNTYKTPTRLFLLMELATGKDLAKRITDEGLQDPRAVRFFSANVLLAIRHIHQHHIVHRDIKPSNLLVDRSGYLKVCDYGFAKELSLGEKAKTMAGTYAYLSPEQCRREEYDHSVDIWSLGITIYEMMYGVTPFEADGDDESFALHTMENIQFKELAFSERVPFSLSAKLFVKGILQRRKHERLGGGLDYAEIMDHPWLSQMDWEAMEARRLTPPTV